MFYSPEAAAPRGPNDPNPIEHQVFSPISLNWAGKPLESYETIVNYIRTTENSSGLRISARLIERNYEKGEKIPRQDMEQLALTRHNVLPAWNYTLIPSKM